MWQEFGVFDAQVVVLGVSSDFTHLLSLPPCVIWIGEDEPTTATNIAWLARLPLHYSASDLTDVLDRAAVFLLDWKAYQRTTALAAMEPHVTPPATCKTSFQEDIAIHRRYRLKTWVFLGTPFQTVGCTSALALLGRGFVTPEQLGAHCELAPGELQDLLQELDRRSVLEMTTSSPTLHIAPVNALGATLPLHKGLARRLSQWLRRASRS